MGKCATCWNLIGEIGTLLATSHCKPGEYLPDFRNYLESTNEGVQWDGGWMWWSGGRVGEQELLLKSHIAYVIPRALSP
jgi:hypothetical protein